MKNLLNNIIDELENDGIRFMEENDDPVLYHRSYQDADRNRVRKAISRAITKSLTEEI